MAKLTPFQKLKRAVSRLSVTSHSKFNQPDFEDSDIEFHASTYRPDFVSGSRPDFVSGSSQNYKNISQTSPPLFYSNDDLNFNYPSVVLNPHRASSSQAVSFGRTTFPPFDRHDIRNVPDHLDAHNATDGNNAPNANKIRDGFSAPDTSDAHNAPNLPSTNNIRDGFNAPDLPKAHDVRDGFKAPDPSDAHNAPDAYQASNTSNPPQNLPRTSQEFVIPENTAANQQTADLKLILTMDPEYSQDVVRCHLCEESNPNLHCYICENHLCNDCEGKHLLDESKEHRFVLFKQRKYITQCQKHPSKKCNRFCERCVFPVCEQCVLSRDHSGHELVDVVEKLECKKEVLKNDLQDLQKIILPIYEDIKNEILIQRNNLKEKIAQLQEDIKKHGEFLNNAIKEMIFGIGKIESSDLANVQSLEDNTEHIISEINESICELNEILNSNDVSLVSAYESRNAEFKRLPPKFTITLPCFTPQQIDSLSKTSIETEERGYISLPEKSLIDEPRIVSTINTEYPSSNEVRSVSCLSDEKVWTRCFNYKIMKLHNLKGDLLQQIETKSGNAAIDITVTMNGDLIYTDSVDKSVNIVKKTQIERIIQLLEWKPLNVCTSLSGDLLVVMINDDKQAKVVRYSGSKEKQTIQYKGNGQPLYSCTNFTKHICENRNRDICVSDFSESKVVVVNQAGNFVAEYTGQRSTPKGVFQPYGITTDSECRMFITGWGENAVYVLDQYCQFLRYIKNRFCDFNLPCGLCFETSGKLFVVERYTGKVKKIQYCL